MSWTPYRPSHHDEAGAEIKVPWPGRHLTSDSIGMDVDGGYAPAGDASEEHLFFLQNDAGSMQLSPGSGFASGTPEGVMMAASTVWSQRRVSNESDSAWSDTLSSLGVTSSTVDEDPFATSDNEDDALPHQPIGRPFYEQTWNQSGTQQALDISSDTYDNVSVQSWNTFYPQPTVDSNLAYTSGRRHSDSQPSQRPVLHRSNPSDSFLAMDMQKLHVGEGSETQSTSPSPSSTVSSLSPWEYPSPASANPANLLQIPTIYRPVTRRYSDSAGQRSRQIPGMLHHSHSESVLGSNDVVVTNGSPIVLGNSGLSNALREPEYCTSISSCPPWTHWPVPLHAAPVRALSTVDPSFNAMFSGARGPPSSSSVAWDTQMYPPIQRNPSIFAAEISSPLPDTREQGRRVIHIQGSESGYQFYGASSSCFTQPNRVAPSGTSENYNLVDVSQLHVDMQNLAGYQTLAALSSAQSYDGAFFPTPEDTAEYYTPNNAFGYANLDSPPILYVGGLCVPEDSESTSATPTMPVPLAVSPTPENAVAGPSTLVLRLGCKRTRGTREPDPQAQQKMRKVNPQPRHFCTVCSPEHSFTIKSALVRHMRTKHSGGPPLQCHICGNHYRDQTSVQRHWRDQHGPNAKVAKPRRKRKHAD